MLPQDIDGCLKISKKVFGTDYHHPFHFDLTNKEHSYLIAEKNKEIIGFSILFKLSKNDMKKIVEAHLELTFSFYYLIDVIAITKKEQKKGAGTSLLKKILTDVGPDLPLYSVTWKDKYGTNIEKLYKNHHINPRVNLGKIWTHGCNYQFKCPSFNKHCQCEGVLFKLN